MRRAPEVVRLSGPLPRVALPPLRPRRCYPIYADRRARRSNFTRGFRSAGVTAGNGSAIVADARLVAVVVAGFLLWRKVPFIVVIVVAAAVAAVIRLLGWMN